MSAHELRLRARIKELASEIGLQKKLLSKLERDKILAQRQLNTVVDPVARLPLEISSEIFLHCLDPFHPWISKLTALYAPMLFLNVCDNWTTIALCTPALWAAIQINFPCAEGLTQLLPIWFQRAGTRPLRVALCGDFGNLNHRVANLIWQQGWRFKDLTISDDTYDDDRDQWDWSDWDYIDLFCGTTPGPLPLLERLTVRATVPKRQFFRSQFLPLLSLAPNLVECILEEWRQELASETLLLSTLRRFMFIGEDGPDDEEILNSLSLPALEVLSVEFYLSGHNFLSFLRRSAPPLQELFVGAVHSDDFRPAIEGLHLIPSLVRLEIACLCPEQVIEFFTSLADSPSLLPNLHDLILPLFLSVSDPSWRAILRALSTRNRIQLCTRINHRKAPPPEVLAAFRELVDDGVQIYIGTEHRNYIEEVT